MYKVLLLLLFLSYQVRAQFDVGISSTSSITDPISGCEVGIAQDSIRVLVQNFNSSFIPNGNINVNYTVDNSPTVTQTVTSNLLGFATINFLFDQEADLSACDTFDIKVWTTLPGDVNPNNDTLFITFVNSCTIIPGSIIGTGPVCIDGNGGVLSLVGMQNGTIIDWQQSTNNGLTFTNLNSTIYDYDYLNVSTQTDYRVLLNGGFCANDTTSVSTITVDPSVFPGTITQNSYLCASSIDTSVSISNYSSTVVNWYQSTNNGLNYTSLSNNTSSLDINSLLTDTYYIAEVSSGTCGTAFSDTCKFFITNPSDAGLLTDNISVCEETNYDSLELTNNLGEVVSWEYTTDGNNWQGLGGGDSSYTFSNLGETTSFRVIVKNDICFNDTSNVVTVTLQPPPPVDAGPDLVIPQGGIAYLNGTGGLVAVWTPGNSLSDSTLFNPEATPDSTTTYNLFVMDGLGCTNETQVKVTVEDTSIVLVVPNTITPNNDGFNDSWVLSGIEKFTSVEVCVYNSYGKLILQTNNYTNNWKGTYKGKKLPDGVYPYRILADGEEMKGLLNILNGE